MLQDLINQANWVDILVVIILIRMAYIGVAGGFIVEIFKTSGLILAAILGLHYYTVFGDFLNSNWSLDLALADSGSLIVLVVFSVILFKYIRELILKFFKIDANAAISKWGGALLGTMRGFLVGSLVVLTLTISHISYATYSAQNSLSGPKLSRIAPKIYSLSFNGLISKFFPRSKINPAIFELLRSEGEQKS